MKEGKEKDLSSRKQTELFDGESFRYITSHLEDPVYEVNMHPKSINQKNLDSILDVGCGNGSFLKNWQKHFKINYAVGVEPSQKGVSVLKRKWENDKKIRFESAYAHQLPFESDSFDLVTNWSVLHWIGRNEYLQSIGEMIRVCSKYLCIMDFVASKDYRNKYHHKEGLFTYKQDFDSIVSASGLMKKIEILQWWVDPTDGKIKLLSKKDLQRFENNKLSFSSRKLVVYEKDFSLLPLKDESDF